MAEREVILEQERLTYEGLFSLAGLYKVMDDYLMDKYYDKRELKNAERVLPDKTKNIEIEIMPWKKFTDYHKGEIMMKMFVHNLTSVEVERDGVKVKLNRGRVHFLFDLYLTYDYENVWKERPAFFLIRTLFDKYFFKQTSEECKRALVTDFEGLKTKIRAYLNLYKY